MIEQAATARADGQSQGAKDGGQDDLREQVARLAALVDQQRLELSAQREESWQLRAEIARLRARQSSRPRTGQQSEHARNGADERASSRRALLKGAGVAAAAATVALVASEGQSGHAAPATDGGPSILFQVDASSSSNTSVVEIKGIAPSSSGTGTGVYGSGRGYGVYGFSNETVGVYGTSTFGNGVVGASSGDVAIIGSTTGSTTAIEGQSTSGNDFAAIGTGRIQQTLQSFTGAPTSGSHFAGEQIRDHDGELWLCVSTGGPGVWVRVGHVLAGLTGGAISFLTKPTRLLDTRGDSPNAYTNSGGPQTGGPFTYQVAGITNPHDGVSIPSSATGAIGKVTVIASSGSGFVALVPSGSGAPNTGTIPYGNGASLVAATSFTVGLGGSPGAIDVYIPGSAADLVIDIFGVVA